jgi:acetoin:2,6-dichlorophenolindophenol oxidoreductase subunit alpha
MKLDIWEIYRLMIYSRRFEEAVIKLWDDGLISGEMHLGIGEEAIIAAVVSQLKEGDAMALDHRGTPPLLMRGIDPVALLLEFLGHPQGLCAGQGGHMHLFSKEHLCASSGIVGSVGPAVAGFGLALKSKKSENIAVAFFGEGSMNQGMLLESMNLAATWNLPVLFVCKDNNWAISTKSKNVTAGSLVDRAKSFGIEGEEVDGMDANIMMDVVQQAVMKIRNNKGPYFIQARCVHKEGHFLGDPLLQFHRTTLKSFGEVTGPLMKAMVKRPGASFIKRTKNFAQTLGLIAKSGKQLKKSNDPIVNIQKLLENDKDRIDKIDEEVCNLVDQHIAAAMKIYEGSGA